MKNSDVTEVPTSQPSSEELFAALTEATVHVFLANEDGAVTFTNLRLRRALGYDEHQRSNLKVWNLTPDFEEQHWTDFLCELRKFGTLQVAASLITREGLAFPVELTVSLCSRDGRESISFFGQAPSEENLESGGIRFRERLRERTSKLEAMNSRLQAEMETRIRTEAKLRESQEQLELAISATKLGLWDWHIGEDRLVLDALALELLRLDPEASPTMQGLRTRIHPDDVTKFDNALERHLRGETERFSGALRLQQDDGSHRWYEVQGRASERSERGLVRRLIGTLQDVSERKNLEDELLQSQKMEAIGRLAGGVAHDFNNLLTAINGYSDLVLRTLEPESPHYSRIEEVRKAGQRAAVLTNRLLSFGRKQLQRPEPMDLRRAVQDLKPLLVPALGEGIDLHLDLGDVPLVRVDLHQVEQALLNLVVNARDAMSDCGQISITVAPHLLQGKDRVKRPHVRVTVKDEGSGIDDEIRPHIFEPFFTTKQSGDGSGLGLPMVYGLVQQSGGMIEVDSAPGRGTEVHLFFPVVEEALSSSIELFRRQSAAEIEPGGSILLVEDEPAVRRLVEASLQERGYAVTAVENANAALEAVAHAPSHFDMMVADVVLGGTNGVELARMLRESRSEFPVLLVSGYAESSLQGEIAMEPGMGFLRKPFQTERLYETVSQLLQGARGISL